MENHKSRFLNPARPYPDILGHFTLFTEIVRSMHSGAARTGKYWGVIKGV
jgi:hypothetical protein